MPQICNIRGIFQASNFSRYTEAKLFTTLISALLKIWNSTAGQFQSVSDRYIIKPHISAFTTNRASSVKIQTFTWNGFESPNCRALLSRGTISMYFKTQESSSSAIWLQVSDMKTAKQQKMAQSLKYNNENLQNVSYYRYNCKLCKWRIQRKGGGRRAPLPLCPCWPKNF